MSATAALRRALLTGDFGFYSEACAADVRLDAGLPGGRRRVRGPEEAAAVLAACFSGPGELVEWAAAEHPEGVALWLERVGEDGTAVRQRQYLHFEDGLVRRHWAYAAPPRSASPSGDGGPAFDPALVAPLGAVAHHAPLVSRGWSGSALERVALADGRELVAKRIVPEADWLLRFTGDRGREALLFREGLLDRLPAGIDHAVLAAEWDGAAWWLVMRDVSGELLDDSSTISRADSRRVLEAANGMWNEFWDERHDLLVDPERRLQIASTLTADADRDGLNLLPKQVEAAWDAFAQAADHDVGAAVLALMASPGPLVAAFDACGSTLLHGDLRDEQLGIGERIVLLDWGVASRGHPAMEYAWYLMHGTWRIAATHEQLWDDFRRVRGERDDPDAVELGVISGLVQYGWILGHSAVVHPDPAERAWAAAELEWWVPRARTALERTGLG